MRNNISVTEEQVAVLRQVGTGTGSYQIREWEGVASATYPWDIWEHWFLKQNGVRCKKMYLFCRYPVNVGQFSLKKLWFFTAKWGEMYEKVLVFY